MSDVSLYEKATALLDAYNIRLREYGINVTLHRRSFTEEVENYSHCGRSGFLNFLEYVLINRKVEEKKYHYTPNRYKVFVLQIEPIKKYKVDKKDYKQYAFWVYQIARAYQGRKPREWRFNEQTVIAKVEKRLRKLQKTAEKSASSKWVCNSFWDALRYSFSKKYEHLESYCGRSRDFWELLWICAFSLPIMLFAIAGLIGSFIS